MNPDLDALGVIRDAATALVAHTRGYDQLSFESDRKTRSAVLYEIVVIGKGVKRLSPEFREKYPEIPSKQIAGMRDRVVHSFDEVDRGVAWTVSQIHAPSLIVALEQVDTHDSAG